MELFSLALLLVPQSESRLEPSSGACGAEWLPTFGTAAGTDYSVSSLAVLDDGSGPALYIGGEFLRAGNVVANGIAKWDGAHWSPIGRGFGDGFLDEPPFIWVNAMVMFDDGSGPTLYAGGILGDIESSPAYAASW